jgi:hypothetical protein
MVVIYATLSLFAVTVAWGLSLEIGLDRAGVVRSGLFSALAVLVAIGLAQVHPQYGLLVGLVVTITSPPGLRFLVQAWPWTRTGRKQQEPERAAGVLIDKVMLDRRFDEIVSQLKESGDFPER